MLMNCHASVFQSKKGFSGVSDRWSPGSGYHNVNPSPWPFMASLGIYELIMSLIGFCHGKGSFSFFSMVVGGYVLGYSFTSWMSNIIIEATYLGCHTSIVARNIKVGFYFFILSEVFFFVGVFWAWFHCSIGNLSSGLMWPPCPLIPTYPWGVPLFNTALLSFSGCSVSWSLEAMKAGSRREAMGSLLVGIVSGFIFLFMQMHEYKISSFTMADGVFGSVFYMLTGLHGLHVGGGLVFLSVQLVRIYLYHYVGCHRVLGLKLAVLYWHFVDIIWVVVFVFVYVWPYYNWVGVELF
uniref:Cytochrome c oxidase subunit 3 n=1 Tax=Macoma balthica TaxID=1903275 RepID=A0A6H2U2A9_MACBL|nr:cytochrome c oxidase subunit III [Macoma balthica]